MNKLLDTYLVNYIKANEQRSTELSKGSLNINLLFYSIKRLDFEFERK